ncbi:ubiquinol-cytochrome C chaperone [Arsenicitalea aurantiaca]|uniref:Ubiquinol-cytochrome C chaperone n=1 Tax=Arsenicitalea aurantiaca TaxID=1783274 RepID=A0A433XER2_9HYPH|nr:ubiquinol-cytochrome C chaperone family protein [Arsenicitalea aurantiaca]RUT32546.1 ubiquinol-cytochrome C chaperone [Arsenicitalea aurantiaca]
MILSLFRKSTASASVFGVYSAIVAQSRRPVFYAEWGVPDTVTGRFDMISLHMALVFRRLRRENQETRDFSQAVFDLFFKDMDRSLREMGAGDLAVPKKIQKMGTIFFGLLASLAKAMDAGDRAGVADVLARNVYEGPGPEAERLADYLMAEAEALEAQPVSEILAGNVRWREDA